MTNHMDDEILVIENASYMISAGFAGDDAPRAVFPTLLKRVQDQFLVGDVALARSTYDKTRLLSPFTGRLLTNFELMEQVWRHTFYTEIRVQPAEHKILLTEPLLNPKATRARMFQLMFDTFRVKGLCIMDTARLALFSFRKIDGVVLDIGHSSHSALSIYQGYTIPHSAFVQPLGNIHVEKYLTLLLQERELHFAGSQLLLVTDIKEKNCCVLPDTSLLLTYPKKTYENPSGVPLSMGKERVLCTELFFQPDLFKETAKCQPIDKTLLSSISVCDIEFKKILFENISLSGGGSLFDGMADRLQAELVATSPITTKINVETTGHGKYDSWIGGSIIASLNKDKKDRFWTLREEYASRGEACIPADPLMI